MGTQTQTEETARWRQTRGASGLIAEELAADAAARVCRLVATVEPVWRSQQDQAIRAAARMPLALAEGAGRTGRDRRHLYRIGYGTARETSAVVTLLVRIGAVDATEGAAVLALLDRVQALTWRLCQT